MPFQWSENAVHIQSLYRPWNVGDGYAEDVVAAAEARLGVRFPALLRHFYRSWGTRNDLTRTNQTLLSPHEV